MNEIGIEVCRGGTPCSPPPNRPIFRTNWLCYSPQNFFGKTWVYLQILHRAGFGRKIFRPKIQALVKNVAKKQQKTTLVIWPIFRNRIWPKFNKKNFGGSLDNIFYRYSHVFLKKLLNFKIFDFSYFFTRKSQKFKRLCSDPYVETKNDGNFTKKVLVDLLTIHFSKVKKFLKKSCPTSKFSIFQIFSIKNLVIFNIFQIVKNSLIFFKLE